MTTKVAAKNNAGCRREGRMASYSIETQSSAIVRQPTSSECLTRRGLRSEAALMHRAGRGHAWVELDLAKRTFVAGYILLQQSQQRFCLLRAQINSLKASNLHLRLALLLQRAEHKEKVPN